jgi:hypothetical protein
MLARVFLYVFFLGSMAAGAVAARSDIEPLPLVRGTTTVPVVQATL